MLYLQGKHIVLFLVSILFLLTLFVPYTICIALGPWLQTKTLWMEAGGVYKMRFLSLLDGFFLVNLGLLVSATFYSEVSDGNKHVSVSISTGATFAVFCLIILCHVIKKIRLLYGNKIFEQPLLGHAGSNNSENSDDALLEFIDEERELLDVTTATINLDT